MREYLEPPELFWRLLASLPLAGANRRRQQAGTFPYRQDQESRSLRGGVFPIKKRKNNRVEVAFHAK
jgi:hypothetical protein